MLQRTATSEKKTLKDFEKSVKLRNYERYITALSFSITAKPYKNGLETKYTASFFPYGKVQYSLIDLYNFIIMKLFFR